MKDQLHNIMKSLLTAILLAFSLISFATETKNTQTSDVICSNEPNNPKLCAQYVRGYLDALQQIHHHKQELDSSSFEERAFRTRVGITNRTLPATASLDICIPSEISDSELNKILTSRSKELPMEIAVLKVIQAKYPC